MKIIHPLPLTKRRKPASHPALILFFIFCAIVFFSSTSSHAFDTDQSAVVATGQPNLISNQPNNGGINSNTLNSPARIVVVGGKMILSDSSNNRILIFNSIPGANSTHADLVIGQPNMTSFSAGVAANRLNGPLGVSSDGTKLYIADTGNYRVLIFNSIPTVNNASADIVIGQPNFTANGSYPIAANTLNIPYAVCTDGSHLFIADTHNARVLIFTSIPSVNNASADAVFGQSDMTSNIAPPFGVTGPAFVAYPSSVYINNGKLFIVDRDNNRVLVFNSIPTSNGALPDLVVGQPDFTSLASATSDNSFNWPLDVAADNNNLYISDQNNNRILIFSPMPTTNHASAGTVIGQPNMTSGAVNQGQTPNLYAYTLGNPNGVCISQDKLLVADNGNHRVLMYKQSPTSTSTGTPTRTATPTSTTTPTYTITPTVTSTPSVTQTVTRTVTFTCTQTPQPTLTITPYEIPHDQVICYPSPATGRDVWFYYYVPGAAHVRIELYDILGHPCKTIEEDVAGAGYKRTHWDVSQVAPGILFYRLTLESASGTNNFSIRKLVIVKK